MNSRCLSVSHLYTVTERMPRYQLGSDTGYIEKVLSILSYCVRQLSVVIGAILLQNPVPPVSAR